MGSHTRGGKTHRRQGLVSPTQGKNRMPELGTYRSMRGEARKSFPYRDFSISLRSRSVMRASQTLLLGSASLHLVIQRAARDSESFNRRTLRVRLNNDPLPCSLPLRGGGAFPSAPHLKSLLTNPLLQDSLRHSYSERRGSQSHLDLQRPSSRKSQSTSLH